MQIPDNTPEGTPVATGTIRLTPNFNEAGIRDYLDRHELETGNEGCAYFKGQGDAFKSVDDEREALDEALEDFEDAPSARNANRVAAASYALLDALKRQHSAASTDFMRSFF